MKQKRKTLLARKEKLNVAMVLKEFEKAEASPVHRRGTFKIEGTFSDALKKILKAKAPKSVK